MTGEPEEWRAVVGWEGLYEVSFLGRVRSLDRVVSVSASGAIRSAKKPYCRSKRGTVLSQSTDTRGYRMVGLHLDGVHLVVRVHRIVCEAFHGSPPPAADAAHNDGNRTNNAASNLRWDSRSGNLADRDRHGTIQRGESGTTAKLKLEQVLAIREAVTRGVTQVSLAREYDVSAATICLIVSRKNWAHLA